jgi:hypothetical protein
MDIDKTWTRWHADGWMLTVVRSTSGEYFYKAQQEQAADAQLQPASSLVDAQHNAESVVRDTAHRCVARCSFWVPDTPDE